MFNKGTKYLDKGNYEKALACFKKFEKDWGPAKENYLNMGNCYRMRDDIPNARKYYELAGDTRTPFLDKTFGKYALALSNLGLLEYTIGNDIRACELYAEAITVDPDHNDAKWNWASAHLRRYFSGEDVDPNFGWDLYEYRFNRRNPTPVDRSLDRWDTKSSGNSIVVVAEQGLGDKIMFGRYVHLLRQNFTRVWVQVPSMLDPLFSDFETCTSVAETDAECCVPICALAKIYGLDVKADWLAGKFDTFEFPSSLKPRVGVVWQGSSTHPNTRNRNCYSSYFSSLADLADLYCLTPGMKGHNIMSLNPKSWDKTASYVNGLDLVICVDTSIVHLAGSLGKETWMLQPLHETDFRWGTRGGISKWYPSVEIINNPRNWDKVFAEVRVKLEEFNT